MKIPSNGDLPKPPRHLSKSARELWNKLHQEFDLSDTAASLLLESALSAWDRMEAARIILARQGLIVTDRFGQRQAHPAAAILRDSQAAFQRALRELHLDLEPLANRPGRRPGA